VACFFLGHGVFDKINVKLYLGIAFLKHSAHTI